MKMIDKGLSNSHQFPDVPDVHLLSSAASPYCTQLARTPGLTASLSCSHI